MEKVLKILILIPGLLFGLRVDAQFVKAELQVSGLTCSMCSKSVDKALHTIPFIETVDVNLETTTYTLTFKNDAAVNPDLIAKKVKDAGFTVSKLLVWFNFNHVHLPKDGHWNWQNIFFMFMDAPTKELNGLQPITFVDYAFIPKKEFLKRLTNTTYSCYKTGHQESCCPVDIAPKTRIYHVVL